MRIAFWLIRDAHSRYEISSRLWPGSDSERFELNRLKVNVLGGVLVLSIFFWSGDYGVRKARLILPTEIKKIRILFINLTAKCKNAFSI